ncbi:hypothetical protein BASA62_001605 [Batrachochytrium salamandrivorans]|nr:hypothetical protein BASA62_001605 [Batrachochytrium salamandrivorans]
MIGRNNAPAETRLHMATASACTPDITGTTPPSDYRSGRSLMQQIERLPLAIYTRVFAFTDTLTRYHHGLLQRPMSEPLVRRLLVDAFKYDCVDVVLQQAPHIRLSYETLFVCSHDMKQACLRFPRSSNGRFGVDLHVSGGVLATLLDLVRTLPDSIFGGDSQNTSESHSVNIDMEDSERGLDDPAAMEHTAMDLLFRVIRQAQHQAKQSMQPASADMMRSTHRTQQDLLEFARDLVECAVPMGFYPGLRSEMRRHQSSSSSGGGGSGSGGAPRHIRQPSKLAFTLASRRGHLDLIADLLKADLDDNATMDGAVIGGHVSIAQVINLHHHQRILLDAASVDSALSLGNLQTLWWLFEQHSLDVIKTHRAFRGIADKCAQHGQLHMLKYVCYHGIGGSMTHAALDSAAGNGHLNIVQYIHDLLTSEAKVTTQSDLEPRVRVSVNATTAAMDDAAANGYLDIIKFLHHNRREGCTTRAMDRSAANGHFQTVMFLHAFRKEGCTRLGLDTAASNGHLNIVQFLHNHRSEGCTFRAMDMAAMHGHLQVLEFLHESRNEGYTIAAIHGAAAMGHLEVFIWLNDHTGYEPEGVDEMQLAASNGHFFIIEQFAMRTHYDLSPLLSPALSNGHLFLAQWIVSRRRGVLSTDMMETWAQQRFPDCAEWLRSMTASSTGSDSDSHIIPSLGRAAYRPLWRAISRTFFSSSADTDSVNSASRR